MERSKYTITLLLAFLSFCSLQGNNKMEIYQAFIKNDMTSWKNTIDAMQKVKSKNPAYLLELINYQYGYIGWCLGNNKEREAEDYLNLAEDNLAIVEKSSYKPSWVSSYKSAFYGFRIGLNRLRAPFYGPKSIEFSKLSMEQDKENPFGYIQYGNSQYYMPAIFGGSKSLAIEYYSKAESLMQMPAYDNENDWNYLSLLTIIAQAYSETKNYSQAKRYFEKILKIEPGYIWVKNELYPQLLKKI
jgi:tetratricopeptide (TPR) repeat protein